MGAVCESFCVALKGARYGRFPDGHVAVLVTSRYV